MKKFFSDLGTALVLVFMLASFFSGAMIIISGYGYLRAAAANPWNVSVYTDTGSFRRALGEYMDILAEGGDLREGLPAGAEYLVLGGMPAASDTEAADEAEFERSYAENDSYVFYIRYEDGIFSGRSSAAGEPVHFETAYENSGYEIFDGARRNYPGSKIMLALPRAAIALKGEGYARLEYFFLKSGGTWFFVCLGLLLFSGSAALAAGKTRRGAERRIAAAVAWIWYEPKLLLAAYILFMAGRALFLGTFLEFLMVLLLAGAPVLFVLMCNVRYAPGTFFRRSMFSDMRVVWQRVYGSVPPVLPMQKRLRRQIRLFAVFGLALPVAVIIPAGLLLGKTALLFLLIGFALYFFLLSGVLIRGYSSLTNGVSELTRLSSALAVGDRLPEFSPEKLGELSELAKNISRIDESVSAGAQLLFRQSNKKLTVVAQGLGEIKEQTGILRELAGGERDEGTMQEIYAKARAIDQLAAETRDAIMRDSPVTAPAMKRMDILETLNEAVHAQYAKLAAAQVKINAKLPPPPAYITADPVHIGTVLDILLSNLAMYARSGTTAELVLSREDELWRFVLVNFESDEHTEGSGSGELSTGLTLARQYISLNGGTLEHTSAKGRFGVSFTLPAAH